jgi:hypothetical protein
MKNLDATEVDCKFVKAINLRVVSKFEIDDSPEGISRMMQAKTIVCDMILLGTKRGRPALQEENISEAA